MTRYIRLKPDDPRGYYFRSGIYDDRKDYFLAIADLTQVIRLAPDSSALYHRARTYEKMFLPEQAIADYIQVLDEKKIFGVISWDIDGLGDRHYNLIIEVFTRYIRQNPNSVDAYEGRIATYERKSDYDGVIADCTQAIRLWPANELFYRYRGNAYRKKEDYDRAIADFTQVIKITSTSGHYERGGVYLWKGDYDRAIADFTQAIQNYLNFTSPYNDRGVAYERKGDYDRAIADYEAALRIDPDYTLAKNNLERARRVRGR